MKPEGPKSLLLRKLREAQATGKARHPAQDRPERARQAI